MRFEIFLGMFHRRIFFFNEHKDNIAFGDMSVSIDEIMRAAQIADVHEDIMAFENGYDT